MRALVLHVLVAAVLLVPAAVYGASWSYVYGGVDDPMIAGNDWSRYGDGTPAVWNVDITDGGGGGGAKAIKFPMVPTKLKTRYYQKALPAGHNASIFQIRVKLEGGTPSTGSVHPQLWRMYYNDGRSRGTLRADAVGGTGRDWVDPDNPVAIVGTGTTNPVNAIAPDDQQWHTYTVVEVDDSDPNGGCYAYWDGQFAGYRQSKLSGDLYMAYFGWVSAPPTGYAAADYWVDYFGWGFENSSDLSAWGDPALGNGLCSGVTTTVLTDLTASWTPGAFAGQWIAVGTPGQPVSPDIYRFNEYLILTNDATSITIASGDMIADGVLVNDSYRICRTMLGGVPTIDPDAAVPEPCSMLALGLGLAALAGRLRRR